MTSSPGQPTFPRQRGFSEIASTLQTPEAWWQGATRVTLSVSTLACACLCGCLLGTGVCLSHRQPWKGGSGKRALAQRIGVGLEPEPSAGEYMDLSGRRGVQRLGSSLRGSECAYNCVGGVCLRACESRTCGCSCGQRRVWGPRGERASFCCGCIVPPGTQPPAMGAQGDHLQL